MDDQDFIARIEGLHLSADEAIGRLEKAKAAGRKRIPGDGDGDGIPYEGKNRASGGGPGFAAGKAKDAMQSVGLRHLTGEKRMSAHFTGSSASTSAFALKNKLTEKGWKVSSAGMMPGNKGSEYKMQHADGTKMRLQIRISDVKVRNGARSTTVAQVLALPGFQD